MSLAGGSHYAHVQKRRKNGQKAGFGAKFPFRQFVTCWTFYPQVLLAQSPLTWYNGCAALPPHQFTRVIIGFHGGGSFHFLNSRKLSSIILFHYLNMPKVSKAKKQRQESATFSPNSRITHLSRQASPSSSAGATGTISAASTPPISTALLEVVFLLTFMYFVYSTTRF